MDDLKDIERKESPYPFFSGKDLRIRAFGQNISGERAYRKAERIVAGVHLVTNHVLPDDLLRKKTREAGLDLLSALLELRDEMRIPGSSSFKEVQSLIRKLISLMQMLAASQYVSLQNASALAAALDELAVFLATSLRTPFSESTELTREDFFAGESLPFDPRSRGGLSKGQKRRDVKDKTGQNGAASNRVEKNRTRRESVMAILKTKEALGIKDIVAHIPEYSEKMIQRELKGLVALGEVVKSGSKRWSLYSLARA